MCKKEGIKVNSTIGQLDLASPRVAESSTRFGWGKGGNVTSAGWQVTLCGPMWHVSSRSGVATLRTAIHLLLTYLRGWITTVATSHTKFVPKKLIPSTQWHLVLRHVAGTVELWSIKQSRVKSNYNSAKQCCLFVTGCMQTIPLTRFEWINSENDGDLTVIVILYSKPVNSCHSCGICMLWFCNICLNNNDRLTAFNPGQPG